MVTIPRLLLILVQRNRGKSKLPQVPRRASIFHFLPSFLPSFIHSSIHSSNFPERLFYAGSLKHLRFQSPGPGFELKVLKPNSNASSQGGRDAENGRQTGKYMEHRRVLAAITVLFCFNSRVRESRSVPAVWGKGRCGITRYSAEERGRAEGRRPPAPLLTACSKAPGAACCCPAPGPDPAAPKSNSCRGRLTGTSGNSGPFRFCCSIMAAAALLKPPLTALTPSGTTRLAPTLSSPGTSGLEKPISFQYSPLHRPLESLLLLVSSFCPYESTIPGLVNRAGVPPRRAASCGWKLADWVSVLRAMLRRGDRTLTPSKCKEDRGWGQWNLEAAPPLCGLRLALLSCRFDCKGQRGAPSS